MGSDVRTARSNSRAAAQRGVGQRELRSKEISKIYLLQNVTKQGLRDMYNIKLDIVEVSEKRKLFIKKTMDNDETLLTMNVFVQLTTCSL